MTTDFLTSTVKSPSELPQEYLFGEIIVGISINKNRAIRRFETVGENLH
jgi:hypothetical protein